MRRFYNRYGIQLICDVCGDTWEDEIWSDFAVDGPREELLADADSIGWWVRNTGVDDRAFCKKHNPDLDLAGNRKGAT